MASWKKYFKPVNSVLPTQSSGDSAFAAVNKYASWLPEIYQGPPNRLERYTQYEQMDMDHEVHAALNTLAEFSTQADKRTGLPFVLKYDPDENVTPNEIKILNSQLKKWCDINDFQKRIFRIFRSTLMYGDQFFIRDPETFKLIWVDSSAVQEVLVNESRGKEAEVYYINNIDLNLSQLVGTNMNAQSQQSMDGFFSRSSQRPVMTNRVNYTTRVTPSSSNLSTHGSNSNMDATVPVDAKHVVHISLTEGLDNFWPFGVSVLESVFKIYKQKELLEDAILIYRVHRAPERRIFYIDVGNMPPNKAQQYLERVRHEVQQKRIPSRTGGGQNIMDSSYNPMSMLEDYYFSQSCLSLGTKIPLLDGRILSISELIKEYKEGNTNYVYSQNRITNEMEPGKIVWADVTRRNAEVVKVHLDNGEFIECTPDHRFILRDGSEVEAQNLKSDDSLMPLYLIHSKTSPKQKGKPYLRYIDNATGKKKWVHTTICPKTVPGKEFEIHHIDFNSRNNNPENLIEMKTEDHRKLHKEAGTYSVAKQWENEESRQRMISGMRRFYDNLDEDGRKKISERNKIDEEFSLKMKEISSKTIREVNSRRKVNYTIEMFTRMAELLIEGNNSIPKMCNALREDNEFQHIYKSCNEGILRNNNNDTLLATDKTLKSLSLVGGYDSWDDFKKNYKKNHKVVEVEWMDYKIDTADITVDTPSNSHIFATAAGVFVHNSDGRGSKVDTLPGGENLGEIDDLRYFNNKMLRALAVPSAYHPTGPEDGTDGYNDGRVGTAFIQEFRFSKTCERHQSKIIDALDREFKIFLKHSGINIDTSMFTLRFTEPQNFSKYRQIELDSVMGNNFNAVADAPFISKRFALQRYLGWSQEEINENERLWKEENADKVQGAESSDSSSSVSFSDVGVYSSFEGDDFEGDEDFEDNDDFDGEDQADFGDEDMNRGGENI